MLAAHEAANLSPCRRSCLLPGCLPGCLPALQGKLGDAATDLRQAVAELPTDPAVQSAYREVREEAQRVGLKL